VAETEEKMRENKTAEEKEEKRKKSDKKIQSEPKENKISFDKPVFILFVILAFTIGALIAAATLYFVLKAPQGGNSASGTCIVPDTNKAEANKACIDVLPAADVGKKVKYFIDESFLKALGYSLTILDVNSYNESLYEINATIKTSEGDVPAGLILATKDGKKIILGAAAYDMNKPLPPQPTPTPVEYKKSDKPDVLMFVMSFCPYGQQAEKGLKPVAELLGDKINFEPHFVIYSKNEGYTYPDYCIDENANYCSMHGISELREDVRQLCIWKYAPEKFWPYVEKIYNGNCNIQNIDTCWKEQASAVGIDTAKIETCFANEALSLLEEEVKLNNKYGVQGSPTVFINETEYEGGRASENYKTAICSAFNTAPSECSQSLSNTSSGASGQC